MVEVLPDLSLERVFEDHESIGEAYVMWPPNCNYRLVLRRDAMKYDLFTHPERYFPLQLQEELEGAKSISDKVERAKRLLFQEYFTDTSRLPDLKGYLHFKVWVCRG